MKKNEELNEKQTSDVVGGDLDLPLGKKFPFTEYYTTVLYCEKDNPSIKNTVSLLVTEGNTSSSVARVWCALNNKTLLDWTH